MTLDTIVLGAVAIGAAVPLVQERLRRPVTGDLRREAPGQFVELAHGFVHYQFLGPPRGPLAVCVHGLTTPSFVWRGLARRLAALGFRVLIYDLYGRGYSDRPHGAQTPAFFVEQLHDLLVALDVRRDITLFGYSMGGVIAAGFTAQHPEYLRRLILIAPAGMETPRLGRIAGFARDWPLLGDWVFHVGYPLVLKRGMRAERDQEKSVERLEEMQLDELRRRGYLRSVLSSLRFTLRRPVPAIHRQIAQAGIPVGAIWGRDDPVVPISGLGQLAQWNRKAQQEVVEGAGHGLPYTHADEIGQIVSRMCGLRG